MSFYYILEVMRIGRDSKHADYLSQREVLALRPADAEQPSR